MHNALYVVTAFRAVKCRWAIKRTAFDTVYMHAEETSVAHTCKSHASQRYAHASWKGDAYIRRDAWSSSSSLHTLVACVWSVLRYEWQTTAASCAIRDPDIPAIDPMTYGTCEEPCCEPNNLRHVVSEFFASCGKEWFDLLPVWDSECRVYISTVPHDSLPEPITTADNMDDDICK